MLISYVLGYEFTRAYFTRAVKKSNLSTLESMAAGAIAGSATVLITNPIWVVNTRMTARKEETNEPVLPLKEGEAPAPAEKKRSPNTLSTFLKILREDGPTRLFAGVLPALVLVINPILQYTIFEQLKQTLEKRRKVTARDSFVLGALGKLAATSITYPYITVKSRAHVATGEGSKEGMTASLKRIVREEGVAGLYGGMCLIGMLLALTFTDDFSRHWTQGHSVCAYSGLPVRLQGHPVRRHHSGSQDDLQASPEGLEYVSICHFGRTQGQFAHCQKSGNTRVVQESRLQQV